MHSGPQGSDKLQNKTQKKPKTGSGAGPVSGKDWDGRGCRQLGKQDPEYQLGFEGSEQGKNLLWSK